MSVNSSGTQKAITPCFQWTRSEPLFIIFRNHNHSPRRKFCCHRGRRNKWDVVFEGGSKFQSSRRYTGNKSFSDAPEKGSAVIWMYSPGVFKVILLGHWWWYLACLGANRWPSGHFCWERRGMWGSWQLWRRGGTGRLRAPKKRPSSQFCLRPPLQLCTRPPLVGGSEGDSTAVHWVSCSPQSRQPDSVKC